MLGLRQKLMLAFGGLLAVLFAVGGLSILLLSHHSETLERISRENYDSVLYARFLQEAVEKLDDLAEEATWGEVSRLDAAGAHEIASFERNLALEGGNVTLPGEAEAVAKLEAEWPPFLASLSRLRKAATPEARRELYRSELLPRGHEIKATAQHIIDLNLANIVSADGEVQAQADASKLTMLLLMGAGALLAVSFTLAIGPSILRPLAALTKSAREVESGNLDLEVEVAGGDELSELGRAFNSMAAKLREFRRSDQARLLRVQRTTELALDSFPDAVAVVRNDGSVELANESAQRLFGLVPGSTLAQSRFPKLQKIFENTRESRQPFRPRGYEATIRVQDGGRSFQPQAVPILGEDGALVGVTLVLADVTNLRALDERKSGLLSVVSHELKTPLTSIRMAAHLLLEGKTGPLTDKQRELLNATREESERLHSTIENLLDVGRSEAGAADLALLPVKAVELLREAADAARGGFEEKRVRLDVVDADHDLVVLGHPARLRHVFANLLDNALRFSSPGTTVRLGVAREAGFARFLVEDEGRGIAGGDLPHVFDRFFRAADQSAGSGAGLGLAIVKEIVEDHGGSVRADSIPGKGSRFSFTLRLAGVGAAAA